MQPHFECSGSIECAAERLAGAEPAPHAHSRPAGRAALGGRRFSSSQAHLQSLNLAQWQTRGAASSPFATLGRPLARPPNCEPPPGPHPAECTASARSLGPSPRPADKRQKQPCQQRTGRLAGSQSAPLPPANNEHPSGQVTHQASASEPALTKPMTSSAAAERQQVALAGPQLVANTLQRQPPPTSGRRRPAALELPPPYEPGPICQQPAGAGEAAPTSACGGGALPAAALAPHQRTCLLAAGPPCAGPTLAQSGGHAPQPVRFVCASEAAGPPTASPNPNPQSAQLQTTIGQPIPSLIPSASPKSKSCLACADISVKWYIVVIALLGLICALIGTIVGAVHSVGRDYLSLALLLVGKYRQQPEGGALLLFLCFQVSERSKLLLLLRLRLRPPLSPPATYRY